MSEKLNCAVCEVGKLIPSESLHTVEIDGVNVEVPHRSHACDSCGMVQGTEADVRFNARAMRSATKQHRKQLTGGEVRSIRQRLCLTQEQAARVFGGGPVAFSKYENDEITQSESMDRLIWLAGEYPWIVAALAARVGLELSQQASLVFERFRIVYEGSYLAHAKSIVKNTRVALEGFSALARASNDEQIFKPQLAMTKLRDAA